MSVREIPVCVGDFLIFGVGELSVVGENSMLTTLW